MNDGHRCRHALFSNRASSIAAAMTTPNNSNVVWLLFFLFSSLLLFKTTTTLVVVEALSPLLSLPPISFAATARMMRRRGRRMTAPWTALAVLPTSKSSEAESIEEELGRIPTTSPLPPAAASNINISPKSHTRQQLEKLTIRELRALLPNEEDAPGFSTLKLKREIVDYIWKRTRQQQQQQQQQHQQQQQQLSDTHDNAIEPYSSAVAPATATATAGTVMSTRVRIQRASIVDGAKHTVWKRRSNSLPPPPATTTISTATATAMEEIDSNKVLLSPPPPQQQRTLSPKDKIMLDVLRRYPPLRTSMLGLNMEDDDTEDSSMQKLLVSASSSSSNHHISSWNNYIGPFGIGEADIRQRYHPMLANVTQSDMDIIFVGTASCTPGITRGVSCTAVRLNRRRRRNDNNDNIIEDNNDNDNNSRGRNKGGGGIRVASGSASSYYETRLPGSKW